MSKTMVAEKPRTVRRARALRTKVPESATQHCIEVHYFDELMGIDPSVTIDRVKWEVGEHRKRAKIKTPSKLTELGVTYMRHLHTTIHCEGGFSRMSRKQMQKNLEAICRETQNDILHVRVRYCHLKHKGTTAVFSRSRKEMRETKDQRRKVVVLGLSSYEGNVNPLLAAVGSKKFVCTFDEVTIRTVVCSPAKGV